MEKEAVQLWLQDVHTAYEESQESDGGLVGPDKSNHSSSFKPLSSPFSVYPQHSSPSPFSSEQIQYSYPQYTTGTNVPFQIPQAPQESNAAIRRKNFKFTKSKTMCDNHTATPTATPMPILDVSEISRENTLLQGKFHHQNSLSPLPTSSSVVMALPTIDFAQTESAPPRKPLVRKSSSKFLSELTTKAPRRPPLQSSKCRSVDIPGVKPSSYVEFPAIPSLSEMTREGTNDEGEAGASNGSALDLSDSHDTGSCVAELSSDDELAADLSMPTAESFHSGPRQVMAPVEAVSGMGQVTAESFESGPVLVGSECNKDFQREIHLLDESGGGKKLGEDESGDGKEGGKKLGEDKSGGGKKLGEESARVNKKSLHRSSSLRHFRSLSDNPVSQISHGPTLGQGPTFMSFHDHNLGRAASSRVIRSPTMEDNTLTRKFSMRHLGKTRSHSPLLENNHQNSSGWPQNNTKPIIRNLLSAPPTRPQAAYGSAPMSWFPRGHISPVQKGEEPNTVNR